MAERPVNYLQSKRNFGVSLQILYDHWRCLLVLPRHTRSAQISLNQQVRYHSAIPHDVIIQFYFAF